MRVWSITGLVALVAVVALSGCGKHDLARDCPKGWTCYAPKRLPIGRYCEHLQRKFEQLVEREVRMETRLKPMLVRLIRQTITMNAAAAETVRDNPWHEPSELVDTALSRLALSRISLAALDQEVAQEDVAPSIALGRLAGANLGCQVKGPA